jgi:hypothetical protein
VLAQCAWIAVLGALAKGFAGDFPTIAVGAVIAGQFFELRGQGVDWRAADSPAGVRDRAPALRVAAEADIGSGGNLHESASVSEAGGHAAARISAVTWAG